jgi:Flp pilus assembly CpaF family ATPase
VASKEVAVKKYVVRLSEEERAQLDEIVRKGKRAVVSRSARMLRTALGPAIAAFLEDPGVVEVMLNPDGRLWIDRLSSGLADTGERLSAPDGERIVRLVAHHVGAEVHPGAPRVSAELPETGERFEGLLPPVVAAPAFAIRKSAVAVFTLDDYAAVCIMSAAQATILRRAVSERRNILVAGGTSTGKTTQILQSVEGPVAKIIAVIIIIVTGLTLAFGDTSGGFRRLIQIVFGLSIAFAASSFFLSFFSFGGGALI